MLVAIADAKVGSGFAVAAGASGALPKDGVVAAGVPCWVIRVKPLISFWSAMALLFCSNRRLSCWMGVSGGLMSSTTCVVVLDAVDVVAGVKVAFAFASASRLDFGARIGDDAMVGEITLCGEIAFSSAIDWCSNELRFESKRDSETVSGRTARIRVTGRVERTLRSIACFSGDTWGTTETGMAGAPVDNAEDRPRLSSVLPIRVDSNESARTASSESHGRAVSSESFNLRRHNPKNNQHSYQLQFVSDLKYLKASKAAPASFNCCSLL